MHVEPEYDDDEELYMLVSIPYRDRYARMTARIMTGRLFTFQFPIGIDMHERRTMSDIANTIITGRFQFPIGIDMHYCKNAALQTYSTV